MALSRQPTALVLRALGLGDLLTAVPALRALRRALPGHRVVLAAPASLGPLVPLVGAVDTVLPVPGLEPFDHPSPEVAVNMHGRGPGSHRVLARLAPRRLVAYRSDDLGIDGPEWTPDEPEVARWCRLVGATLGGDPDPEDRLLRPPDEPPATQGAVVVHPGAAYPSRRWPSERYAQVAARLAEAAPVTVTGTADEAPLAERVCRLAGLPGSANLAGRTSLPQLAALVAAARLVISGDTGIAHLAYAYRTPSVVLFGPTPPAQWGPPARGPHVVLWHGAGPGDPWASRPDPVLLAIAPDEVLAAAGGLLSDPSVPDRRGGGTSVPGCAG